MDKDSIKELRKDFNLSQKQLAEVLSAHGTKVSIRTVQEWELGRSNVSAPYKILLLHLRECKILQRRIKEVKKLETHPQ